LHVIAVDVNVGAMATTCAEKIADDSVVVAMKHFFPQLEINELDIAAGLKELLCEMKYNMNSLLRSDANITC